MWVVSRVSRWRMCVSRWRVCANCNLPLRATNACWIDDLPKQTVSYGENPVRRLESAEKIL